MFGGLLSSSNTYGVIDLYNPMILGPLEDIETFFTYMLSAHPCTLTPYKYLECTCGLENPYPNLNINIDGNEINIPPHLLLETIGENMCKLLVSFHEFDY